MRELEIPSHFLKLLDIKGRVLPPELLTTAKKADAFPRLSGHSGQADVLGILL